MKLDREVVLLDILNEVHAASAYIMEFGRIETGTPQSRAMIKTLKKLKEITGKEPMIPNDYPWR